MGAACVVTQGGRCIIRKPWGLVSHSAVAVSRLSNCLTDGAPQTLWLVLPDIGMGMQTSTTTMENSVEIP